MLEHNFFYPLSTFLQKSAIFEHELIFNNIGGVHLQQYSMSSSSTILRSCWYEKEIWNAGALKQNVMFESKMYWNDLTHATLPKRQRCSVAYSKDHTAPMFFYYYFFSRGTSYGRGRSVNFKGGSFDWKSRFLVLFSRIKSDHRATRPPLTLFFTKYIWLKISS